MAKAQAFDHFVTTKESTICRESWDASPLIFHLDLQRQLYFEAPLHVVQRAQNQQKKFFLSRHTPPDSHTCEIRGHTTGKSQVTQFFVRKTNVWWLREIEPVTSSLTRISPNHSTHKTLVSNEIFLLNLSSSDFKNRYLGP